MIIAQISDTHLTLDEKDSARRIADFRNVIADINTLDPQPDVIVHTGDIVQNGLTSEYAVARDILGEARAPVFVIPGNKDDRSGLQNAFSNPGLSPDGTFVDYAVEDHEFRLIFLDTITPASKKGDFCEKRFDRLDRLLSQAKDRPTLVFMHHPPFEVLVGPERHHYDDMKVAGRLAEVLDAHDQIKGIFCGHVHRPTTGRVGSVPATIAPAVATPVRFGSYPDHMANRAIYFLHRFEADGTCTTETQIVDRWF